MFGNSENQLKISLKSTSGKKMSSAGDDVVLGPREQIADLVAQ
jgi:hypothetical protein